MASHIIIYHCVLIQITFVIGWYLIGEVWPNYEKFTKEQLNGRDEEVINALQHNLNNTLIDKIHILYFKNHEIQVKGDRSYLSFDYKTKPLFCFDITTDSETVTADNLPNFLYSHDRVWYAPLASDYLN